MFYTRGWLGVAGVILAAAVVQPVLGQRTFADPTSGLSDLPAGIQADAVATPETSVGAALRNLASRSDIVFVGQVERIDHASGVVSVTFSIEQPVIGDAGGSYTLKEWAGLWTGGRQRYFLGQRTMVFLHAAGAAGLSSPVDGMDGVVPVVVQGADAEPLLDVRWLEARVQRPVGSAIGGDSASGIDGGTASAITLQQATETVQTWDRPNKPEPIRLPLPAGARPLPVATGGILGLQQERIK